MEQSETKKRPIQTPLSDLNDTPDEQQQPSAEKSRWATFRLLAVSLCACVICSIVYFLLKAIIDKPHFCSSVHRPDALDPIGCRQCPVNAYCSDSNAHCYPGFILVTSPTYRCVEDGASRASAERLIHEAITGARANGWHVACHLDPTRRETVRVWIKGLKNSVEDPGVSYYLELLLAPNASSNGYRVLSDGEWLEASWNPKSEWYFCFSRHLQDFLGWWVGLVLGLACVAFALVTRHGKRRRRISRVREAIWNLTYIDPRRGFRTGESVFVIADSIWRRYGERLSPVSVEEAAIYLLKHDPDIHVSVDSSGTNFYAMHIPLCGGSQLLQPGPRVIEGVPLSGIAGLATGQSVRPRWSVPRSTPLGWQQQPSTQVVFNEPIGISRGKISAFDQPIHSERKVSNGAAHWSEDADAPPVNEAAVFD